MVCPVCGNELSGGSGHCPTCNVWVEPPADTPGARTRDWSAGYTMSFLFFPVALILWAVLYAQPSADSQRAASRCLVYGFLGFAVYAIAFALIAGLR